MQHLCLLIFAALARSSQSVWLSAGTDENTGEPPQGILLWSQPTADLLWSWRAKLIVGPDGTLFSGEYKSICARHGSTGELLWRFTHDGFALSPPALGPGGILFAASYGNSLFSLNASTGSVVWDSFFATGGRAISSPTVGSDSTVFVSSSDAVYAFTGATGQLKWRQPAGSVALTSPTLGADGSSVYFASFDAAVYALDRVTGEFKWRVATGGRIVSAPTATPDGATVLVASYDSHVYAIDTASGAVSWRYATGTRLEASPAAGPGGAVYVGGVDAYLHVLDSAGHQTGHFETDGAIITSPTLAGSVLLLGSNDHYLYVIDRGSGDLLWEFQTGGPIDAPPVMSADGSSIFVACSDGLLYAIAAPPGPAVVLAS